MTDYAELVERLRAYFTGTGILVGLEAADAIEELVKDRGANRSAANESYKQGLGDGRDEMRERAEKAEADHREYLVKGLAALDAKCAKIMQLEADLAAARAALLAVIDEDGCTCSRCMSESEHAPAIAAAQADICSLGEPCRSCTGHIRENNLQRCHGCTPGLSQNYVARKEGGE